MAWRMSRHGSQVHIQAVVERRCVCRPCSDHAAVALQHGFFPATPINSPAVCSKHHHAPVWVDISLLGLLEATQYESKHAASVTAFSAALVSQHRDACPAPAEHGGVRIQHLKQRTAATYIRTALREYRHVKLTVRKLLADAMHPRHQLGHLLRGCAICSQGIDDSHLPPADARLRPSKQGDSVQPPPKPLIVSKVRTCHFLQPLDTASEFACGRWCPQSL